MSHQHGGLDAAVVDRGRSAPAHAHEGHGGHTDGRLDHAAQFRRLFWIMLVLTAPTVAFSGMFADLLGYRLPDVAGLRWIAPALGTVMYVWGGRPFLSGALGEVRSRRPGMMLLISLAITVAFVSSWGASSGVLHHDLDFWWELALLSAIMLLGHWLEMRSLAQTSSAVDSLAAPTFRFVPTHFRAGCPCRGLIGVLSGRSGSWSGAAGRSAPGSLSARVVSSVVDVVGGFLGRSGSRA
jgi:P-type Cu2+ transporter